MGTGSFHTCALREDSSAICWGSNEYKQATPPGGPFASINGGTVHTCGLRPNGSPVCWGNAAAGQASPPDGESFSAISTGSFHSCGLRHDGPLPAGARRNPRPALSRQC